MLLKTFKKSLIEEGFKRTFLRSLHYTTYRAHQAASKINYYEKAAPVYYKKFRSYGVDKYRAPIDPFSILYINPAEVEQYSGLQYGTTSDRFYQFGTVRSGDWDLPISRKINNQPVYVEDHYIYRQILAVKNIIEGDYEKARTIQTDLSQSDMSTVLGSCESLDEFESKYDEYFDLYKNIRDNGYSSQMELYDGKRTSWPDLLDEVAVDIGRDGQFLLNVGKHRFYISKILEIEKIPIVVLNRHKIWMAHRDICYEEESKENHPDLFKF